MNQNVKRLLCLLVLFIFVRYLFFSPKEETLSTVNSNDDYKLFSDLTKKYNHNVKATKISGELSKYCTYVQEGLITCTVDTLYSDSPTRIHERLHQLVITYKPTVLIWEYNQLEIEVVAQIVDKFLTSHLTWTVEEEPYAHSETDKIVLREVTPSIGSTFSIEWILYKHLEENQYTRNCGNVLVQKINNNSLNYKDEFSTIVDFLEYGLTVGLATNRTFISPLKLPFKSSSCADGDWSCYFLPYTNCVVKDAVSNKNEDLMKIIRNDNIPYPYSELISKTGIPNSLLWWRVQLLKILLRPNYKTREKVSLIRQKLETQVSHPCLAMHIPENKKLSQYMSEIKDLNVNSGDIFVAFEGEKVEDGFGDYPKYQFSYVPRRSNSESYDDESLYWILVELELASQCRAFLGTFSSNYSALLYKYIIASSDGPIFHVTLDHSNWHVLY